MTQIENESEHCVFVAKVDERISQIAKELGHGCTAHDIVALNVSNPVCQGVQTSSKLKANTRVWLPVKACCAYLCEARVADVEKTAASERKTCAPAAVKAWLEEMDLDTSSKRIELDKNRAAVADLGSGPLASHIPLLNAKLQTLEDEISTYEVKKRKLQEALSEHDSAVEAEQTAIKRRLRAQSALATAWRATVA